MASEDVEFRLNLANRAQTAAGIRSVASELDNAGDQAGQAGRQAAIAGRQFDTAGRLGSAAGKAIRLGFVGVAAAGYGAFKFSQSAIEKASDLSETVNKSNVIFGDQAKSIRIWSRSSAESFGLSKEAALGSAASFGDMFTQIGFVEKQSAKMSKNVVAMAADFGSFNNLGTDDVLERISAGFRGEYDSLQKLVPNINAARVGTEALALSGKKNADNLTAQDKALAVLNILHTDGARAAGDFERTSDGLANSNKILGAEYDNVSAKIGKTLLPLQLDLVNFISDRGIPALNDFADWFREDGAPAIGDFVDKMRPLAAEVLPAAKDALGAVRDIAEGAAPYVTDLVGAFRGMPDWAQKAIVGGVVIGGAAAKLKNSLPGQAASGALGAVLGAKPVPVFVTNPGFGGAGGVTGGKGSKGGGLIPLGGMGATGYAAVTSAPDVFSTLASSLFGDGTSNLQKAAEEFGYDMDRLATDIRLYGDQGDYFKQVQSDLEDRSAPGAAREILGFFNPFITDNERAATALDGLRNAAESAGTAIKTDLAGPIQGPKVTPFIGPRLPSPTSSGKGLAGLLGGPMDVEQTIKIKTDPPTFTIPGMPETKREVYDLNNYLSEVGRRRIEPKLTILGLEQARSQLSATQAQVDRLSQPRTGSVAINVDYIGGARPQGGQAIETRATGGPIKRGRPYWVGEEGPELVTPERDGYVHPTNRFPHLRTATAPSITTDDTHSSTRGSTGAPINLRVEIDGREVAAAVYQETRNAEARA